MNLVLNLKIYNKNKGKDVNKCTIKYSGFFLFKILNKGKNEKINIIKYENLLFIKPVFGK